MKNLFLKLKALVQRVLFFRSFSKKDTVMDSAKITKRLFKHITYVNARGVLCFQSKNVVGEVIGISEWPEEIKRAYHIDSETMVIDVLITPIPYTE